MSLRKVLLCLLFAVSANGSMLPDPVIAVEFDKVDCVGPHIIIANLELRGLPDSTLLFPYHIFRAIDPNCIKEINNPDTTSFIAYIKSGHAMDVSGLIFAAGQYFTAHNIGYYDTPTRSIQLDVSERESKSKLSNQLTNAVSQLFASKRTNKFKLFTLDQLTFELTKLFREGDRTLGVLLSQAFIKRTPKGLLEEMTGHFSESRAVLNHILHSVGGSRKKAEEQVNVDNITNAIEKLVTLHERFREGNDFNDEERELDILHARIRKSITLEEYLESLQQYFSSLPSQAILSTVAKDDTNA